MVLRGCSLPAACSPPRDGFSLSAHMWCKRRQLCNWSSKRIQSSLRSIVGFSSWRWGLQCGLCYNRKWRSRNPISGRRALELKKRLRGSFSTSSDEVNGRDQENSLNFSLDWDPFEDLFGLGIDMRTREHSESNQDPHSWYGPEGQYVREVPCPTCRGRGYMPCPDCNLGNGQASCPQCSGKEFRTCTRCLGECVVWEESVNESAWESARKRSPLNAIDDDAIDSMDIPDIPKKQSQRVYGPPSAEVREKISRALKALEKRTGAISRRVQKQHQDPVLHAKMVAAIKRSKSTEAARLNISEKQKAFFRNPENRHDRGLQMKGLKFFCKYCGQEGHRRNFCPDLGYIKKNAVSPPRLYCCSLCKQPGHRRSNCPNKDELLLEKAKPRLRQYKPRIKGYKRESYKCGICRQVGHTRKLCPERSKQTP